MAPPSAAKLSQQVTDFNKRFPIGTSVRYWTRSKNEPAKLSKTRTHAEVLSGHSSVVWVDGYPACIALNLVEPVLGDVFK